MHTLLTTIAALLLFCPAPGDGPPAARGCGRGGTTIFGAPRASDDRFRFTPQGHDAPVEGLTVLEREAFLVGHHDRYRVPAFVAMRWSREDYERGEGVAYSRRGGFVPDEELPAYARAANDNLEYARTGLERGHMAPDGMLEAFGYDAVRDGMLLSNVVPQMNRGSARNHDVWGRLEDACERVVADPDVGITTIWIVSGPIFKGRTVRRVGDGIGVPSATYKVVAWFDEDGRFRAMGLIIPQGASDPDLSAYLVPVDDVEEMTGLDFFPGLDDEEEAVVEGRVAAALFD